MFSSVNCAKKLTGDLCLGHPSESEPFPGVELPQVGAAPVRPGHRARCCRQTRQHAEKHRETHLLEVELLVLVSYSPEDFWSE